MHHGGNFQAMSVTNAMEKTRLAMHHIGKLLFAQCTELVNPATSRGLPPNLVAEDPSASYVFKGADLNVAALAADASETPGAVAATTATATEEPASEQKEEAPVVAAPAAAPEADKAAAPAAADEVYQPEAQGVAEEIKFFKPEKCTLINE